MINSEQDLQKLKSPGNHKIIDHSAGQSMCEESFRYVSFLLRNNIFQKKSR